MDLGLKKENNGADHFNENIVVKTELLTKLMKMEMNRMSETSYGVKFEFLKKEEKKSIINLAVKLFKKEYEDQCLIAIKNDLF